MMAVLGSYDAGPSRAKASIALGLLSYGSPSKEDGMGETRRSFSDEFKAAVVGRIQGGEAIGEVCDDIDVFDSVVRRWTADPRYRPKRKARAKPGNSGNHEETTEWSFCPYCGLEVETMACPHCETEMPVCEECGVLK